MVVCQQKFNINRQQPESALFHKKIIKRGTIQLSLKFELLSNLVRKLWSFGAATRSKQRSDPGTRLVDHPSPAGGGQSFLAPWTGCLGAFVAFLPACTSAPVNGRPGTRNYETEGRRSVQLQLQGRSNLKRGNWHMTRWIMNHFSKIVQVQPFGTKKTLELKICFVDLLKSNAVRFWKGKAH